MAKKQESGLAQILAAYEADTTETYVSTGITVLDYMLGGGICLGGMYSMWGEAGCGKSTVASNIVRSFCEQGYKVCIVDVEKAMNSRQFEAFGLDEYRKDGTIIHLTCSDLIDLENVTEYIEEMGISFFVIDSWSALMPGLTKEMKVHESRPGLKALQTTHLLQKIRKITYEANIASLVLFHARANIQIGGAPNPYSPTKKQDGGFAARHVPDLILQVALSSKIKDGDVVIGNVLKLQTEKNKFTAPSIMEQKLYYGVGIKNSVSAVDFCIERGIITKSGSIYELPTGEKVRGANALYELPEDVLRGLQDIMEDALQVK